MIEKMRAELAELSAGLQRGRKIDAMLQSLQEEEQSLARRGQELKAILSKEEADVERLEKTTASSILYAILGKKDDKLDEEQREAYAARLKYDAAVRQLDDCKARIDRLRREKSTFADCAGRYDRVFSDLRELLRKDPAYAERLCALERQRGEITGQLKELEEAIRAGGDAMRQIDGIESSLGSAEGWGTWDLLGGGLISDLAKHSHLDEAQAGAERLPYGAHGRFRRQGTGRGKCRGVSAFCRLFFRWPDRGLVGALPHSRLAGKRTPGQAAGRRRAVKAFLHQDRPHCGEIRGGEKDRRIGGESLNQRKDEVQPHVFPTPKGSEE